MERKDYEERLHEIKDEILDEIRGILGNGEKHYFKETFSVHYVEGEAATTEVCSAVEVSQFGMVIFHVINSVQDAEMIDRGYVYSFDPESFLNILDHLKKDVREKKIGIIRELLKNNGGSIDFKENFEFLCADEGDKNALSHSLLKGVVLDNDKILVKTIWKEDGNQYDYYDNCLLDEELDNVITRLKSQSKKKFMIRVSGSYSRMFHVEASSYEEALAEAKKDWESNPLSFYDSNGEDWDDWTNYHD